MQSKSFIILILLLSASCGSDDVNSSDTNSEPTVITQNPTNIQTTSARIVGEIVSNGGSNITEKGIYWDTSPNSEINGNFELLGSGVGLFFIDVSNLTPNTTYYTKAYAKNSVGISLGEEKSFNTLSLNLPTVNTQDIQNIEATSAKLIGEVESDGGTNVIERGFCWGTSPNPTINDNIITDANQQIGFYNATLSDLSRDTTYYVRSYCTNSVGLAYGEEIEFTTLNNYFAFTSTINIVGGSQNEQDKVICFLAWDIPTNEKKIISYNYDSMEVISELTTGYINTTIGSYNNQQELYVLNSNGVSILNTITLQEIATIDINDASSLSSIQVKNNLIFVSTYYNVTDTNKVRVYSRSNLTLVTEIINTPNSGQIVVYNDTTNNNIKCVVFPNGTNANWFREFIIDSSGNLLATNNYSHPDATGGGGTNDDASFIIRGSEGKIFYKNDLNNNNNQTLTNGSTAADLKRMIINSNASYIYTSKVLYTSQEGYHIDKYNTTDFTIVESIVINEEPKLSYLDTDQLIIVSTTDANSGAINVYLSFYDN